MFMIIVGILYTILFHSVIEQFFLVMKLLLF